MTHFSFRFPLIDFKKDSNCSPIDILLLYSSFLLTYSSFHFKYKIINKLKTISTLSFMLINEKET